MSAGLGARLLLAAASVHLAACSSNASIRNRGGGLLEARIAGSDAGSLLLDHPGRGTIRLPREQVEDIDHPGNVVVMAGVSVLLVGAYIIASEHQRGVEMVSTGLATGVPGLAMITWGASTYLRSRDAAAAFEDETFRLITPDPNRPYLPAPTWTPQPAP